MRMRLRQIVMVAADLDPVERQIEDELGVELCYRDPGVATFGLRNALFPIGGKLLEVVSPTQERTTAGRLLDKRGVTSERIGFKFDSRQLDVIPITAIGGPSLLPLIARSLP